ncbi:hypothetical protein SESBI_01782 [Sesbania bispinosa]|nr:hypothetical protein SESBI_01782 [Sesbania bispinosa]
MMQSVFFPDELVSRDGYGRRHIYQRLWLGATTAFCGGESMEVTVQRCRMKEKLGHLRKWN